MVSSIHTSSILGQGKSKAADDQEIPEFQEDLSSGLKNLERVGLAKQKWSWPQYNRIVYPPTENGQPIRNPVSCPGVLWRGQATWCDLSAFLVV